MERIKRLATVSPVGALEALYRNENLETLTWEWSGNEFCQECGAETLRILGNCVYSAPTCLCKAGMAEFERYLRLLK
jgi:hypothetical protein